MVICPLRSGGSPRSSRRHAHPSAAPNTSVEKTPRLNLPVREPLNEARVAAAFIACMTGMPSHRPTADLHPVTRGGHVEGSTKAGLCPHEPGTGPVQPARAIKAKSARSVTVDCLNLARSRCRAARRRLQAGRRQRREQVSGYGPVRPRLERVPSGGGGFPGGVPGRAVRPRKPACSCGQG